MNNENLSKQLCEICGVKPKKIEISCNECPSRMEECGCFDCEKEIYPDFEQPENFVRLCNIIRNSKIKIWDGIGDGLNVFHDKRYKNIEEEVLSYLLSTLKAQPIAAQYGNKFNTFQEQCKQAIRSAEWKWV